MNFTSKYYTKIGWLCICGTETAIGEILFSEKEPITSDYLPEIYHRLNASFHDYFEHNRWTFDVNIAPNGTVFQKRVWKELQRIPFGKTITYLDLARRLGDENVIRAAASANGKNPISILIPCHRVVGKNGNLVGYAGGLFRKKFLLELEQGITSPFLF